MATENLPNSSIESALDPHELLESGARIARDQQNFVTRYEDMLNHGFSSDNPELKMAQRGFDSCQANLERLGKIWALAHMTERQKELLAGIEDPKNPKAEERVQNIFEEKIARFIEKAKNSFEGNPDLDGNALEDSDPSLTEEGGGAVLPNPSLRTEPSTSDRDEAPVREPKAKNKDKKSGDTTLGAEAVPVSGEAVSFNNEQEETPSSLVLLAQNFEETHLLPSDLLSGSRQAEAIALAYSPKEAAALMAALKRPADDLSHQQTVEKLTALKNSLDESYKQIHAGNESIQQLTEATVSGAALTKIGNLFKEVTKSPFNIAGALIGLYALHYLWKSADAEDQKSVKELAAWGGMLLGGTFIGDAVWKTVDREHRGLFARLNMNKDMALPPELLARVAKELKLPEAQKGSLDEMCALYDFPAARGFGAFEKVAREGRPEMDPRSLSGLKDESVTKAMNPRELRDLFGYTSGMAADLADLEAGLAPAEGETKQEKEVRGTAWILKNCSDYKMGPLLIFLQARLAELRGQNSIARASAEQNGKVGAGNSGHPEQSGGSRVSSTVERGRTVEHVPPLLEPLLKAMPVLRGRIETFPGGVETVLVAGYPYKFRADTENKMFSFADALDPNAVPVRLDVDQNASGSAEALLSQGSILALKALHSSQGPSDSNGLLTVWANREGAQLRYVGKHWEALPPFEMSKHEGLSLAANEAAVPLQFVMTASGFEIYSGSAGDEKPYPTLKAAIEAYEKNAILKDKVSRDFEHLMLGVELKVVDVKDDAAGKSTTVTFEYGHDKRGTAVYKNNSLDSASSHLDRDDVLDAAIRKQAAQEVRGFFKRDAIADELAQVTQQLKVVPTGYVGTLEKYMNDAKDYLFNFMDAPEQKEFDSELVHAVRRLQDAMHAKLVALRDTSSGAPTATDLAAKRGNLEKKAEFALQGLVRQSKGEPLSADQTAALAELNVKIEAVPLTADQLTERKKDGAERITKVFDAMRTSPWYLPQDGTEAAIIKGLVDQHIAALNAALGASGVTLPQATQIVDAEVRKASTDAYSRLETSTDALIEKNVLNEGIPAEWKQSTLILVHYLRAQSSWSLRPEADLAARGPFAEVLRIWKEKIKGASTTDPEGYTKYFITQLYSQVQGARAQDLGTWEEVWNFAKDPLAQGDSALMPKLASFASSVQNCSTWSGSNMQNSPDHLPESERAAYTQFKSWYETVKMNSGEALHLDPAYDAFVAERFNVLLRDHIQGSLNASSSNSFDDNQFLARYESFVQAEVDTFRANPRPIASMWNPLLSQAIGLPKFRTYFDTATPDVAGYKVQLNEFITKFGKEHDWIPFNS